uniref:Uncharacterized protein n=1 Tax=Cacopsylla melanoneura TaxID=428564 RepID=A0A8D8LJF7_9HEMI
MTRTRQPGEWSNRCQRCRMYRRASWKIYKRIWKRPKSWPTIVSRSWTSFISNTERFSRMSRSSKWIFVNCPSLSSSRLPSTSVSSLPIRFSTTRIRWPKLKPRSFRRN